MEEYFEITYLKRTAKNMVKIGIRNLVILLNKLVPSSKKERLFNRTFYRMNKESK